MGWDGAGGYTRQHNFSADASAGINILASRMDVEMNDFASAMTLAWARDGQNTPTQDIPMGGRKFVNVGAPASVSNFMRVREFIESIPIFMQDAESSADRISVSTQYFTSVSANQAPADGTKIMVRVKSNKSSAVMYVDGHSANVEYQDGNRIAAALVSGGIYEFTYSSVDAAWKVPTPSDGRTAAEISAGVTPTNYQYSALAPYMLTRILTPNSTAARAANSTALKALLDPANTGPVGWFAFPNTTGADTYYFDAQIIQIRDGCRLELCGCTLDFSGSYSASNNTQGFLTAIRDVSIVNGKINVSYDGSLGTNNGMALLIGSRIGYAWAGASGLEDEDLSSPMGNCVLDNLRITTNNPGPEIACLFLGGLENVTVTNIVGNGSNVVEHFIYYEFGDYHYEATVANRKTSHAINLNIKNVTAKNLKSNGSNGAVVSVIGANSSRVENIHGDTCYHVVEYRCGEALFYNVGAPYVTGGKTRWHTIANITGQNITSNSLSLVGSESAATGYLSGEGLSDTQQCDLQGFVVDGFSVDESVYCNGPLVMRGGTIRGAGASGGIIIGADCLWFSINGTHILDGAGAGVRANIADTVRGTARRRRGEIIGCKIAGNVGAAIGVDVSEAVLIERNQLGYDSSYDASNEATQTSGVSCSSDARGVYCAGNRVKTAAGTAYVLSGSGDRYCDVRNAYGERTLSGAWLRDGIAQCTSAQMADATDIINTADKYEGKLARDNSVNRLHFSLGSGATDGWRIVDGSATVTPA